MVKPFSPFDLSLQTQKFEGEIGTVDLPDLYVHALLQISVWHFYPPPDEVGAGGIGVASDVRLSVRPSRVRMSAFRFRSRTR